MDRGLIVNLLKAAEEHVANDEQQVADQRDLVSTLERTGHTATSAIALLTKMEQTQLQHITDRDRLRAELTALTAGEAAKVAALDSKKPVE